MTKEAFLKYCRDVYGTCPDYPFEDDFETAVLRHSDNRKWYALVMSVSCRKFGIDSDEVIEAVNVKIPIEMFGTFTPEDGVYPAYHMNKRHWVSIILSYASSETVEILVDASFKITSNQKGKKR